MSEVRLYQPDPRARCRTVEDPTCGNQAIVTVLEWAADVETWEFVLMPAAVHIERAKP